MESSIIGSLPYRVLVSIDSSRNAEFSGRTCGFLGVILGARAHLETPTGLVVLSPGIVNSLEVEKAPTAVEAEKLPDFPLSCLGCPRIIR